MIITPLQWRQIVDSIVDTAIISTDRECRVTSWNMGAVRILGYEESEMLGRSLDTLFTPEDQKRRLLNREIADAISSGRGGGEEGWRVRKNGDLFWAIDELTPIRDGNAVIGFVKILHDRTSQHREEEQLRKSERQKPESERQPTGGRANIFDSLHMVIGNLE